MKVLILLKNLKTNRLFFALILFSFLSGLFFVKEDPLEPRLESPLPCPKKSAALELAFTTESAKLEYQIANSFLLERSLSPTLTGFKKALILSQDKKDASMCEYGLIYSYFLAKKWTQLKAMYTSDALLILDQSAPYFKDALIMFFIALREEKTPFLLQDLERCLKQDVTLRDKLEKYESLLSLNQSKLVDQKELNVFLAHKKSSKVACFFNLLIPGSGYGYLGQWQSALTAFILLGLLMWALYTSTRQKQLALSFLLLSIFSGFYWGSIVGVAQSTKFYNQTLYSAVFDPLMKKEALYPEMWIQYAP